MNSLYERFLKACTDGCSYGVERFLSSGVDIHAEDDKALCCASREGHADVVKLLLASGANVHARSDEPIYLAVRNGRVDAVDVLLKSGSNLHSSGVSMLYCALTSKHVDVIIKLLEFDIDINELSRSWYGVFGREAPSDLSTMTHEQLKDLLIASFVEMELE